MLPSNLFACDGRTAESFPDVCAEVLFWFQERRRWLPQVECAVDMDPDMCYSGSPQVRVRLAIRSRTAGHTRGAETLIPGRFNPAAPHIRRRNVQVILNQALAKLLIWEDEPPDLDPDRTINLSTVDRRGTA